MNALHKAMENEKSGKERELSSDPQALLAAPPDLEALQMEMQRRTGDGKMFWRCYFNAVSCF